MGSRSMLGVSSSLSFMMNVMPLQRHIGSPVHRPAVPVPICPQILHRHDFLYSPSPPLSITFAEQLFVFCGLGYRVWLGKRNP